MQLDLGSRERSISVDSRLEGFPEIAAAVASHVERLGHPLDETTLSNLKALGVRRYGDA